MPHAHARLDPPAADTARAADTATPAPPDQVEMVLVRDGRRFAFRCRPGEEPRLLERLCTLADDPASDLTWQDAARLSHQISRRLAQAQPPPQPQAHRSA